METEAKHGEVVEAVTRCRNAFAEGDFETAAGAANTLVEMDCGVCSTFGHHLLGLAMAASYAPGGVGQERIRDVGVAQSDHIRANILDESDVSDADL